MISVLYQSVIDAIYFARLSNIFDPFLIHRHFAAILHTIFISVSNKYSYESRNVLWLFRSVKKVIADELLVKG